MLAKCGQIKALPSRDCRHTGAAVATGHLHAVYVGCEHAVESADRFFHLGGRYVLALPTERVADPVDEVEIAILILAHQVAGAKPDVAFDEYVVQDLLLGLGLSRVAFEALPGFRRILEDLADHLARLARFALDAEAMLVADRLLALDVEAHDLGREAMGQEPGDPADGTFLALEVEHGHVAFGGSVELDDLGDPEAFLELVPDIGPQAVAAEKAQPVRALFRMRWRIDEIAAELADILHQRTVPARDVVPKLARRKFLAQHDRAALDQHGASREQSAGGVIHRQAVIHA